MIKSGKQISALDALHEYLTPRRSQIDPELLRNTTPLKIPFKGMALDGCRWGASERVIIFMHGWEGNLTTAFPLAAPLNAAGFSLLSFNSLASGWPQPQETNLLEAGDTLFAAIHAIGDIHAVIGHSFGAAATLLLEGRTIDLGIQRVVTFSSPSDVREHVLGVAQQKGWGNEIGAEICDILDARLGHPLDDLALDRVTGAFSLPGLVIHDRKDRIVPFRNAQRIVRNWQNSRLLETSGLGHHRAIKNPEVISQVVAFLKL